MDGVLFAEVMWVKFRTRPIAGAHIWLASGCGVFKKLLVGGDSQGGRANAGFILHVIAAWSN